MIRLNRLEVRIPAPLPHAAIRMITVFGGQGSASTTTLARWAVVGVKDGDLTALCLRARSRAPATRPGSRSAAVHGALAVPAPRPRATSSVCLPQGYRLSSFHRLDDRPVHTLGDLMGELDADLLESGSFESGLVFALG